MSKLKSGEDEYKIQLRYDQVKRNDIQNLINMRITFRDFNTGRIKQVPISAVAKFDFTSSTGGIKRKNNKRTIQLQSNVTDLTAVASINQELKEKINQFQSTYSMPDGVSIRQTGESEQQQETNAFLGKAFIISLGMIFLILVLQFNSVSKPFIVLTEIFSPSLGVPGLCHYRYDYANHHGIGRCHWFGGYCNQNGILLLNLRTNFVPEALKPVRAAIQAGKIRIIPVLLTAVATILGLFPLAIGFNIDFGSLFTHLIPKYLLAVTVLYSGAHWRGPSSSDLSSFLSYIAHDTKHVYHF